MQHLVVQSRQGFKQEATPGLCSNPHPHRVEAAKAENIARECAAKGMDPRDHPGSRYYLCGACGRFHPSPPPA